MRRSICPFLSMSTARFDSEFLRFKGFFDGVENATLGILVSGMAVSWLLIREEYIRWPF